MYKNKVLESLLLLVISLSCLICFVYILINQEKIIESYKLILYFPIFYFVTYYLFIHKVIKNYGISIFLAVYIAVSFFRYIVLSFLVIESQWFFGRSTINPNIEQFETAIILMVYEIIVYSIFIYIFHKKLIPKKTVFDKSVRFPKQTLVYFVFIGFVICMMLLSPSALNYFSFFVINDDIVSISEVGYLTAITAILLNIAKLLLMLSLISIIYKMFNKQSPILGLVLISILILLNVFIYFGSNRSDFIFNAIASFLLLIYLYKKLGILLSAVMLAFIPIVISSISSHRQSATITGGDSALIDFTDTLQIYLAGVYNVAIGVDLAFWNQDNNPFMSLLDLFRSAIGPNVILQNFDIISSSLLFNNRIYMNDHVAQIIPMISQGQFYFGFLFSPLIGVIVIFIAVYFTRVIVMNRRIEIIFILSLFAGRMGFVMAQNGNIFINDLTFFLPLYLIIFLFNNKIGYGGKL